MSYGFPTSYQWTNSRGRAFNWAPTASVKPHERERLCPATDWATRCSVVFILFADILDCPALIIPPGVVSPAIPCLLVERRSKLIFLTSCLYKAVLSRTGAIEATAILVELLTPGLEA